MPSSYDRKTPVAVTDLLNDRELLFFEEHEIALSRVLTEREQSTFGATATSMSCTWRTMLPRVQHHGRPTAFAMRLSRRGPRLRKHRQT